MQNFVSLIGFFGFMFVAWILSVNRSKVSWRPVVGGVVLQFIFAIFVFLIPTTRVIFLAFSAVFNELLAFSREGIIFVFGELAHQQSTRGVILAFQVLPLIIVFSSIMTFLYYVRLIPLLVKGMAKFLARTLRTSGAESLCVASNVFVGIESATAIRPYIRNMTDSELFTILVAGMATIASSVLAVYVSFLQGSFPLIAGHLISASILSAPATFVISKLMLPETETPKTMSSDDYDVHTEGEPKSVTESIVAGAMIGARLAVAVGVTLIAVVGILGIIKGFFAYVSMGIGTTITLDEMLSWIFYPFVLMMGIPLHDASTVAQIMGTRLVASEIPAYLDLAMYADAGGNPRTVLITSYALCGFAHLASLGIFVGGIGAIAPCKLPTLSRMGPRALIAATIVTMMTGAMAGIFFWGQRGIIS